MSDNGYCVSCNTDSGSLWAKNWEGYCIYKCRDCGLRWCGDPEEVCGDYSEAFVDQKNVSDLIERCLVFWPKLVAKAMASVAKAKNKASFTDVCVGGQSRCLDIGTGTGFLPLILRFVGAKEVWGLDLNEPTLEKLKTFGIKTHFGEIATLDENDFDFIFIHHVLEHVPQPLEFLKDIHSRLASEGLLHVFVPNEGSLMSKVKSLVSWLGLKSKKYRHLDVGHHLFYFTPDSLCKLLQKAGFEVKVCQTVRNYKKDSYFSRAMYAFLEMLDLAPAIEVVASKSC